MDTMAGRAMDTQRTSSGRHPLDM